MMCIRPISNCVQTFGYQVAAVASCIKSRCQAVALCIFTAISDAYKAVCSTLNRFKTSINNCVRTALCSLVARFVIYSLNELKAEVFAEKVSGTFAKLTSEGSTASEKRFEMLSTVAICYPQDKNPTKKTVIYVPSKLEIWQQSVEYLACLHKDAGVDVYSLNFRGSGTSNGFPLVEATVIEDVEAFVASIIKTGVDPKNIVLFGDDIGATYSIKAAAALADKGYDVNVIASRCYKSLTSLIRSVFPIAQNFIANSCANLGWSGDAECDLPKLKGSIVCVYSDEDPYIPQEEALKSALDNAPAGSLHLKKISYVKMSESDFAAEFPEAVKDPAYDPHIRPFTTNEHEQLMQLIRELFV